jgi:hypothetical protein
MKPTIKPMSNAKDTYIGVLLEQIRNQNKAIREGLQEVPKRVELHELRQDVAELKQDMQSSKTTVADLSRDLTKQKSLPAHEAHGHA